MDARIHVVGVGPTDTTLLERLAVDLTATVSQITVVLPWKLDPKSAHDPLRNQYNSSQILSKLFERPIPEKSRLLGVTDSDLFAPVLTYVFGEAQLNGPTAVVSTHRLRPELYGLDPNPDLLSRRLLVEAVHELGHTAGLRHCPLPRCAMNGSTYVEEIDLKGPGLCPDCQAIFDQSFV